MVICARCDRPHDPVFSEEEKKEYSLAADCKDGYDCAGQVYTHPPSKRLRVSVGCGSAKYDMDGFTFIKPVKYKPDDMLCDICITQLVSTGHLFQHWEYWPGGGRYRNPDAPQRSLFRWLKGLLRDKKD